MPLQKALVPVPIDGGLDTKIDIKQEESGFLRKAENIVYETLKLIKKRNGYDLVSLKNIDGTNLSNTKKLTKYKTELLTLTNNAIYGYSESLQKWIEKGTLYPTEVNSKVIIKNADEQKNPCSMVVDNFQIFAWSNSDNTVRFSVLDIQNKNFIASNQLVGTGAHPKIGRIANSIYIFYIDAGLLKYRKFAINSPANMENAVTAKSNVDLTNPKLDVDSGAETIFVAYNSNAVSSKVSLFSVDKNDSVSSAISPTGENANKALSIYLDNSYRIFLAWSDGSKVAYAIYALNFQAAILSSTTIETIANVSNVSIIQNPISNYSCYYEISQTSNSDNYIKRCTITVAGVVSGTEEFKRSLGLSSKLFMYNNKIFIPTVHGSDLQPTYFLLDEDRVLVTKFNNQTAGGVSDSGTLNKVYQTGDTFLFASSIKNRTIDNNGTFYSTLGVSSNIVNFEPQNKFQNAYLAENLHICSGILKMYDGKQVAEHGFNIYPENLSQVSPITATTKITTTGTIPTSEKQLITFSEVPTDGSWSITIGAETTSLMPATASNATIKSNLEVLTQITTATVTGDYSAGITIEITSPKQDFPLFTVSNNTLKNQRTKITNTETTLGVLGVKEVQHLDFTAPPTTGAWQLKIGASTGTSLAFGASPATIKSAIQTISGITTVTVTGDYSNGFDVTFDVPITNIGTLQVAANTLTDGTNPITIYPSVVTEGVAEVKEVQHIAFSNTPNSGAWTIQIGAETTTSLAFGASNAAIKAALEAFTAITTVTVTGSYATGISITFDSPVQPFALMTNPSNTLLGPSGSSITTQTTVVVEGNALVNEVQTINFSDVPTSGTFKIRIGLDTSTVLSWSSNAAEIKAAIQTLGSITDVTVTGSFAAGFTVTFNTPQAGIAKIEIINITLSNVSSTGKLSDGNRAYVAVYRWTDNNGRDHRSSPTPTALTVILAGGTSTQFAMIKIPTLRLTEKENVVIELYRTEDAGTTFYLVTDALSPIQNDDTVDYVLYSDVLSDEDLISHELLYTTGSVIENIPAPACNIIAVYRDRLAIVGEDKNTVVFSKAINEGGPVEFTDLITKKVDPIGGDISALGAMKEKLAVFESDATFYISGAGPNNTGTGDSFTDSEIVAGDIGCTEIDSVILVPTGIMFKSRKGIYMLSSDISMSYIGARVEAFNDSIITSAEIVGELNQIRFTTSVQNTLVYNYTVDKWAIFTNHGALSSVVIDNDYYYLREDGDLYKENRTSYSDAGTPIKMRFETAWSTLSAIQGYQRVYSAMLLGTYKSPHKLKVKIAYNYVEAYIQEADVIVGNFINENTYGEDSPYGEPQGIGYGGGLDANLYQVKINMQRQKCQAIKLLIEDAQDVAGEGLTFSAITARVGVKDGEFKQGIANKFSAT